MEFHLPNANADVNRDMTRLHHRQMSEVMQR